MIRHENVSMNARLVTSTIETQEVQVGTIVVIDEERSVSVIAAMDDVERDSGDADAG